MKTKRKFQIAVVLPLLAYALSFTPLNVSSQSSPDATTSFYGDVALNPFKQPNYKTHGAFTLNYYGSGDVNNDGVIDWTDYNSILGNTSDRADVDGNGTPGQSADKAILLEYLTDASQRQYLPAHWDLLQNRTERINWFEKVKTIDQTQVPKAGWVCTDYSKQFFINLCGIENITSSGLNFNKMDTTKNARFNIPIYEVETQTNTGVSHQINAVLTGDSTSTFNNGWYFVEPQNDTRVFPGNVSMGANSFANIKRYSYFWSNFLNQYVYDYLNLVNFDLQSGQVISTTINPAPEVVLYRNLANVHLQGAKPTNTTVNWENGTINLNPSNTGSPTGVSPSETQVVYSDSTNQGSGDWNPQKYNFNIYRDWKLVDTASHGVIDTTLGSRRAVFWNNGRAPQIITAQDTAKPVPTTTINGLTLYYTQRDSIPTMTATDNCGVWACTRTITSNQGTDQNQCNYFEFTKTVKDSLYDPSGNYRVVTSLVNIVLDPSQFTYVPPTWALNWPDSTDPSNTGGSATATNPAGVQVNITHTDNSTQDSDTTKCEHYHFNIDRTWIATTVPCNNQITATQWIYMNATNTPTLTYVPNDTIVPVEGCITPECLGKAEGEDYQTGQSVNPQSYDSIISQGDTTIIFDRHHYVTTICGIPSLQGIQNVIQEIIEGVPEKSNSKDVFKVYPNPTNSYVNFVYTSNKPETAKIIVNDLTGRKLEEMVVEANAGENKSKLNVSDYPIGTYIIQIILPDTTHIQKMCVR